MQPSDQEILPSLDDEADDTQDDDDEDDIDDDEDMMADEATDTDDDDYDSDEDTDDRTQDDEESWDSLSTPQQTKLAVAQLQKDAGSSTPAPSTTQKVTDAPSPAVSSSPVIDPYFTHFDPRAEHQSYKVKVRSLYLLVLHI